jgi:CRISPR-associated protein Cas6
MPEPSPADAASVGGNAADVAFDLEGTVLAADYSAALMREIAQHLPWIGAEPEAGIHALRAARADAGDLLLTRRAKLVLRLPERRIADAMALCGREIAIGGRRLAIGAAKARPLAPFGTLYAHLVAAESDDEQQFMREMAAQLQALRVACELICGKRRTLQSGEERIAGYSLMLHGLSEEHSLLAQRVGLGGGRMLGCGIFVGHKSVVAVS